MTNMANMLKPFTPTFRTILVLGSKVAVKRYVLESTSPIITPDTVDTDKLKPILGEVISVGAGRVLPNGKRVKPSVKRGDIIYFIVANAAEITKGVFIIDEDNILAVKG